MNENDEFAEFDMAEDEFDQKMAGGQPVQIIDLPTWLQQPRADLYTLVTHTSATYGTSEHITPSAAYPVASEVNTHAVAQRELVRS